MKLRQEISSSTINIAVANIAEKRAPKQKGGCPDTLDTPLDPPLSKASNALFTLVE